MIRRSMLVPKAVLCLVLATVALSSVVMATTTSYPVSVTSCDGSPSSGQLCTPIPTVTVSTGSVLLVEFIASPGHCSAIKAHLLVDSLELYVSPALGPGVSTGIQDLGPVSAGSHTVGVQAEGVVGGCNAGDLVSWAGTLNITTATFAGTPGQSNCHGKSVSALARQYGGMSAAASALGYASEHDLQTAIHAFCGK